MKTRNFRAKLALPGLLLCLATIFPLLCAPLAALVSSSQDPIKDGLADINPLQPGHKRLGSSSNGRGLVSLDEPFDWDDLDWNDFEAQAIPVSIATIALPSITDDKAHAPIISASHAGFAVGDYDTRAPPAHC